jgi:serine/threonine protein kinase
MKVGDPFKLVGAIVEGRYRIERVAGCGGHGVVYRAFHLGFEAPIALKVLKLPEDPDADPRRRELASFRREGRALFELSLLHPSIVRAFETGVAALPDGRAAPYLALEWLDGFSLDRELKHRRAHGVAPLEPIEAFALLDAPARALALAHARGVAHRDVKPGNLFFARNAGGPALKILDFGVAKFFDDSLALTARLAETGPASSFTPMYAAPEQWLRRLGATGPWTDVHAWALVFVELVTGRVPLLGDEAAELMSSCLDAAVRPTPRALGREISHELEAVLACALAVDPRARFRDLGELWAAVGYAVQAPPGTALSPPPLALAALAAEAADAGQPSVVAPSSAPLTRPTASRSLAPARRNPRRRAMVAAGAVALSIGGLLTLRPARVDSAHPPVEPLPRAVVQMGASSEPRGVVSPPPAVVDGERELPPTVRKPVSSRSAAVHRRSRAATVEPEAAPPDPQPPAAPPAEPAAAPPEQEASRRPEGGLNLNQIMDQEELSHRM